MKNALFCFMVIFPGVALGESLPPVGKRVYLIEADPIFGPVKIKKDNQIRYPGATLRDPIWSGQRSRRNGEFITKPAPKDLTKRSSVLSFSSKPIKGRLSKPRVSFTLEPLDLDEASIPLNLDVKQRLLDQVRQQEDLARSDQ